MIWVPDIISTRVEDMMFYFEYASKAPFTLPERSRRRGWGQTYTRRATQRHTSDKSLRHIGGEAVFID